MGRRPIDAYTRSRIGILRGEGRKLDEIWDKVKDDNIWNVIAENFDVVTHFNKIRQFFVFFQN